MDALAANLQQSLSPDPQARRNAERQLDGLKAQPGFSQLVLQLAQNEQAQPAIRQSAALLFKNFVRNGWAKVSSPSSLPSRQLAGWGDHTPVGLNSKRAYIGVYDRLLLTGMLHSPRLVAGRGGNWSTRARRRQGEHQGRYRWSDDTAGESTQPSSADWRSYRLHGRVRLSARMGRSCQREPVLIFRRPSLHGARIQSLMDRLATRITFTNVSNWCPTSRKTISSSQTQSFRRLMQSFDGE